jgi:N-acetylmuramoyl-L-alanine amidase
MKICMSSGHGKYISGAVGPSPWGLHEHTEAVRVVDQAAIDLRALGIEVMTFEDTISHSQNENLNRIVDWHNSQTRDMDISVHFNANETTSTPMGTEVLYVSSTGLQIATRTVNSICTASGLKNRGPKKRTDLFFLNNTEEPAALIETCFVDSHADVDIYHAGFGIICNAIAAGLAGEVVPGPTPEPPSDVLFSASGTCSWFGGPTDTGVSPSEGLAFIYDFDEAPYLFLPQQPPGTSGLARRLDPSVFYIACRWNYDVTSKLLLRDSGQMALVTAKSTGVARLAHPADWGPHEEQTGRAADLSPGLMDNLGLGTDDLVDVIYPYLPD